VDLASIASFTALSSMLDAKYFLSFCGLAVQYHPALDPLLTFEHVLTQPSHPLQMHSRVSSNSSTVFATLAPNTNAFPPTVTSEGAHQTSNQAKIHAQAVDSKPESPKAPSKERPQYTCPDGEETFHCFNCGGAKNIAPWKSSAETNAECMGVCCALSFSIGR
jgi:hypothetical protein